MGCSFTAGNGNYDFAGLGPDTYWVRPWSRAPSPAGFFLTTNNDPMKVTLAKGQDFNDADFGYASLPEIAISKTLASEGPLYVGGEVVFNIHITNIGPECYRHPAFAGYLRSGCAAYLGATPASDDTINDGVIDWSDLTASFGSDLGPANRLMWRCVSERLPARLANQFRRLAALEVSHVSSPSTLGISA